MSLNRAFYARFENRGIALKALADEVGVTAFYTSEIGSKKGISDRVVEPQGQEPVAHLGFQRRRVKAIAERIGRDHRESFPAHNFSSPEWNTLKQLAYL